MRRTSFAARLAPFVALSLAACASAGSGTTTTSAGALDPDAAPSNAQPLSAAPLVEIQLTSHPDIGLYLVEATGRALYVLVGPEGKGMAECTGPCTREFEPVLGRPMIASAERAIDEGMLGTTVREDGTRQATFNGMPLYRHRADQVSTHVRGHSVTVGGATGRLLWPDGKLVAAF